MISFHGDKKVKQKYLDRVIMHQKADHLVRGLGWEKNGENIRGCAVGCTLEAYNHKAYEKELGIPEWLAKVEDTLFEGMSLGKSKTWPEKLLKAIPVGVNLEPVKAEFLILVLNSALSSFDHKKYPQVKKSIEQVIWLWHTKGTPNEFKIADADAAAAAAAYVVNDADAAAAAAADAAANAADANANAANAAYVAYADADAYAAYADAAAAYAAYAAAAAAANANAADAAAAAAYAAYAAADAAADANAADAAAAAYAAAAAADANAAAAAYAADAAAANAANAANAAAAYAANAADAAAAAADAAYAAVAAKLEKYDYFADELLKMLEKVKLNES